MSEEVSKRIDDLHKRFDDLRGDVNQRFDAVDRRLDQHRGDMNQRFEGLRGEINQRFEDLRGDMNERFGDLRGAVNHRFDGVDRRFGDLNQRLTTFMWVVSGWFTFLTAVLAVFGFLRL